MAKIGNAIIQAFRGRKTVTAIRRDGTIISGHSRGHSVSGRVKPGLTVGEIADRLGQTEGVTVRVYVDRAHVVVTEQQAMRRRKARERARARREEQAKVREQARQDAIAKLGTDDPIRIGVAYNALRYGVQRQMFCPLCERILDVSRAKIAGNRAVCAAHDATRAAIIELAPSQVAADRLDSVPLYGPWLVLAKMPGWELLS